MEAENLPNFLNLETHKKFVLSRYQRDRRRSVEKTRWADEQDYGQLDVD